MLSNDWLKSVNEGAMSKELVCCGGPATLLGQQAVKGERKRDSMRENPVLLTNKWTDGHNKTKDAYLEEQIGIRRTLMMRMLYLRWSLRAQRIAASLGGRIFCFLFKRRGRSS